jgi:hypothetical protein
MALVVSCNDVVSIKKINPVIQEISRLYQTGVTYKTNFKIDKDEKVSYILVKIKESDIINDYPDKYFPSSNIAVLLAKDLNFDEYRIEFIKDEQASYSITFYKENVNRIIQKLKYFDTINEMFKNGEYDKIYDISHNSIRGKMKKNEFVDIFKEVDAQYGKIDKIIVHGYKVDDMTYNEKDKFPFVGYLAIFRREKGDMRMSTFINETNNEVFSIIFDWRR